MAVIFCQRRGKPYPSSESGKPIASCCRFCGLVQLGTLHIVKISSRRQKNDCTLPPPRICKAPFESSLPRNESKPRLLWRSCERWLTNFRIFMAWITESRSHFERRETVKRFTKVSLRHRRAELCRAQSLRMIERRLVAVCFSLSLPINWIHIWSKGGSFYCALHTKSMYLYVMCLQD